MATELLAAKAAAGALSLVINGTPVQATYLQGGVEACEMSARAAQVWRRSGKKVIERRVAEWCTAGTVIAGRWVSEQWRNQPSIGSFGWRVEIPLSSVQSAAAADRGQWPLDVMDHSISTRVRYRQSTQGLFAHHRESHALAGGASGRSALVSSQSDRGPFHLSPLGKNDFLLSGRHPDGGSYSIVIERGLQP